MASLREKLAKEAAAIAAFESHARVHDDKTSWLELTVSARQGWRYRIVRTVNGEVA